MCGKSLRDQETSPILMYHIHLQIILLAIVLISQTHDKSGDSSMKMSTLTSSGKALKFPATSLLAPQDVLFAFKK